MLIDNIAPDGMKSSYFSAQSLGWLGGAFNPLMTGGVLTYFPAKYPVAAADWCFRLRLAVYDARPEDQQKQAHSSVNI